MELHALQYCVLMPEGLYVIDRREQSQMVSKYDVEYDPLDKFVALIGPAGETRETCLTPTSSNYSAMPRPPR